MTATERFHIKDALSFGPWRQLTDGAGRAGGRRLFSDEELEAHWLGWAKDEPRSPNFPEWDESSWAVRRFELGEDAEAAFVKCRGELGDVDGQLRRRADSSMTA